MEAFVAYFHYIGILGIASILSAEFVLLKKEMTSQEVRLIQKIDLFYLLVALTLLGSGLTRVFWFAKGSAYYFHNWIFYLKMLVFSSIGCVSIIPTITYLKWNSDIQKSKTSRIKISDFYKIRRYLLIQLILLPWVPLFAVLMARGYGVLSH